MKKVHEEYKNELASAIEDKLQNVMDFLKDCEQNLIWKVLFAFGQNSS